MMFRRKGGAGESPPYLPPLHCPGCGRKVRYWIMSVSVDSDCYSTSKIRAEVVSDHACRRNTVVAEGVPKP